jgi:hypothetical protein
MSYILNKTDGNVLVTLLDGTTSNVTGLTFIGRNYPSYGEIQNENFIRLLENFASTLPPGESVGFAPVAGTLWWDTGNQKLKVYNGSTFITVSERNSGASAPSIKNVGDQWFDTSNNQLKVWTGTEWLLIGPAYNSAQGKSGVFVETVTDTTANTHVVVNSYIGNRLVNVISYDPSFTPSPAYTGFTTIEPGLNVLNTTQLNGTATDSVRVGGLYANVLARTDTSNTFNGDVTVTGNVILTDANISFANKTLTIQNKNYNGNIDLFVNGATGNKNALRIDGSTGLISVAGNPITASQIANKNYVDIAVADAIGDLAAESALLADQIAQVQHDYEANISVVIESTNANLSAVQAGINANVNTLTNNTAANVAIINANLAEKTTSINTINSTLTTLAPINSPAFTGNPTAPISPNLSSYIADIGRTVNYQITISSPIAITKGSYITRIDASTYVVMANLNVLEDTLGSLIPVNIISGSLTPGPQTTDSVIEINGTLVSPPNHVTGVNYLGPLLAYPGLNDNSGNIATTSYVDATANLLHGDYTSSISTVQSFVNAGLNNLNTIKANINSPTFTGNPQAPTPTAGDSSTSVATTAFVKNSVETQRFRYTVSGAAPSGGNDGDFWFQIG